MNYFLLGIGYTSNSTKPYEIILGTYPWSEPKHLTLEKTLEFQGKIYNADITDNLDLVGIACDLNRYTRYDANTNHITKRSYTVLAKASTYKGNVYFIADGFSKHKWKYKDDILEDLKTYGITLSNAKMITKENLDIDIVPIGNEFEIVDFIQAQLEYRKYLKNRQHEENKDANQN